MLIDKILKCTQNISRILIYSIVITGELRFSESSARSEVRIIQFINILIVAENDAYINFLQ